MVKLLLLIGGVNPNSKDADGETPLLAAAAKGHEAVVKLLVAINGIDLNSKDNDGMTPLSWAVAYKHEAVVKLLVTTDGVDPDYKVDSYAVIWRSSVKIPAPSLTLVVHLFENFMSSVLLQILWE